MASSGGSAKLRAQKDREMAARMKRENVKRHSARCPVCHRVVNLKGLQNHIITCGG